MPTTPSLYSVLQPPGSLTKPKPAAPALNMPYGVLQPPAASMTAPKPATPAPMPALSSVPMTPTPTPTAAPANPTSYVNPNANLFPPQQGPAGTPSMPTLAPPTTPGTSNSTPSAPATPQISPETQAAMGAAEKAYADALRIGPAEFSTEEDIQRVMDEVRKLEESGTLGSNKIRGQAIPLNLLVGQEAQLQRQVLAAIQPKLAMAESLQTKMARLQAQRQSAIESSRFSLDRFDQKVDRELGAAERMRDDAESARRFSVQQSLAERQFAASQVPDAPQGFELSEGEARYDAQGNLIASRGKTYAPSTLGSGGGGAAAGTPAGAYRTQSAQTAVTYIDKALAQLQADEGALNIPFFGNNVTGFGASTKAKFASGSAAADFGQTLETIKSNIGFDALQAMREASKTGGALGSVAVQELEALQKNLGSLSQKQSPAQLRSNLESIKTHYTNILNAAAQAGGGAAAPTGGSTYKAPSGKAYNLPY